MAHNDYGAAPWVQFTTNPGARDAELTAPTLSSQRPFQQQLPPMYQSQHMFNGNPSVALVPGSNYPPTSVSLVPTSSYPTRGSPLPSMGNNRQQFPPPVNPYQAVNPARPLPVWNEFEQPHSGQAFYDTGVPPQGYPSFPRLPGYNPPLSGSLNFGLPYNLLYNDQGTSVGPTIRNARADTVRGPQERHHEPPPGARARPPRPPPQAQSHAGQQMHSGFGQPPWLSFGGPSRRSDRSTSPRASNRRNFERYSVDLSQSSTSSDAEEAAARAPPLNRMRHRPREVRLRYAVRHPHVDPNVATARQIQELKHSLQRHLPSALPEKASKACDICQKAYATAHAAPTEDEEIAVELACGHTFGEFCISQWFDTCRTHKNKVTCPMCRKQLIEPPQCIQPVMHASPRGQAFIDLLAREHMHAHGFQGHFSQS